MALEKIRLGTNEDGSPHYLYRQTDPSIPLVVTGPIQGTVEVNGTVYDVTEPVIEVQPGDEIAVSNAIGERHVEEGHPLFADEPHDFVHEPTEV
jgi:hypothetical protein